MEGEQSGENKKQKTSPEMASGSAPNGENGSDVNKKQTSISERAFVDRINISDRWMILLTGAIAATGIVSFQLSVMKGQLAEMKSGGLQEDKLIEVNSMQSIEVLYVIGRIEYDDIFEKTPHHNFDWCIILLPNDIGKTEFSPFNVTMDARDVPKQ